MKAYCPKCEELRDDDGSDAWGFVYHAGTAICQRCHSIVEISEEDKDNEIETIEDGEEIESDPEPKSDYF